MTSESNTSRPTSGVTLKWNNPTSSELNMAPRPTLTEAQIQSSCVIWLWNTHPQTRGLFFSVTNNSEHIARAMQRKAVGLISGVSDCLFIWRGSIYCFEFKTAIGRQSPAQIEWQTKVNQQGINYYLVRSLDEFKKVMGGLL